MSRRLAVLGGVALGLLLLVLGTASRATLEFARPTMTARTTQPTGRFTLTPSTEPPVQLPQNVTAEQLNVPGWVKSLLALALAALLIGAIVFVASRVRLIRLNRLRRPDTAKAGEAVELSEEDVAELGQNFRDTIERLRLGADLDDSIIDCWRQVEAVAARQGLARRATQTADEFTLDVLSRTTARRQDMERLADLYRAAMFSTRVSTEAEREAAIACLERLSRDLVVVPEAPAQPPAVPATDPGAHDAD